MKNIKAIISYLESIRENNLLAHNLLISLKSMSSEELSFLYSLIKGEE